MKPEVLAALPNNPKGDPLEVARIAGIMAAKRTAELIPMCHPLPLALVDVDLRAVRKWRRYHLQSSHHRRDRRGNGSDGCGQRGGADGLRHVKGADKSIEIREIVLERKSGGKSGEYRRAK